MKYKAFLFLSFFAVLILLSGKVPEQDQKKRVALLNIMIATLTNTHYLDINLDDSFSNRVYLLYLDRIDFGKRFLTRDDVDKLSAYRFRLDDFAKNPDFTFYDLANSMVDSRVNQLKTYTSEVLSKSFDFTKDEYYELDDKKVPYASTEAEWKNNWRKYLKYQVLLNLSDKLKEQEQDSSKTTKKSQEMLEADAREKVQKTMNDFFHNFEQMDETDRLAVYMNAIVNAIDPHTEYFPPEDKENFDIAMSGSLEGIGATLQEKDGYIKVVRIVPGSPSWKQGQLKAGDIILKVAQGEAEPVDVVGMKLDKAVRMIRGKKGTEVRLTVKKPDGAIVLISIIRDVVIIEETYAKSAVVKNLKSGMNVGYIKLPQFYADFNNSSGRTCSKDMKKEIAKLMAENDKIQGLVVDLRDNGGGSLQDAVDIAGLFFEKGPVVQVKSRTGNPMILEDRDPAIQYSGPVVIMVNTLSASASEILAAALQDYHRAIIVGSNYTFGKGTVQRFYDLDNYVIDPTLRPMGSLKVTMQKFYRINGGSTQLKGVSSDIALADELMFAKVGERDLEYPLPWNQISKAPYKELASKYNLTLLQNNSRKRIAENPVFGLINEKVERSKKQMEKTLVTLNLKKFMDEMKLYEQENRKFDAIDKEIPDFKVNYLNLDYQTMKNDSSQMARMDAWFGSLKKDAYLFEAVNVLGDMK